MSYKWVWPEFHVVARWASLSDKKCSLNCIPVEVSAQVNVKVRPYFTAVTVFSLHFWTHFTFLKGCPPGKPCCLLNFFFPFCFSFHLAFFPILFPFFKVVSSTYSEFNYILSQRDKKINKSAYYCFQGVFIFASLLILELHLLPHLSQ